MIFYNWELPEVGCQLWRLLCWSVASSLTPRCLTKIACALCAQKLSSPCFYSIWTWYTRRHCSGFPCKFGIFWTCSFSFTSVLFFLANCLWFPLHSLPVSVCGPEFNSWPTPFLEKSFKISFWGMKVTFHSCFSWIQWHSVFTFQFYPVSSSLPYLFLCFLSVL